MKRLKKKILKIKLEYMIAFAFLCILSFILLVTHFDSSSLSLNALSRLYNAFFATILTSLAMIITLTSNLYSPKLIKVLLQNKIIIIALGLILVGNFLIIICESIPHNHWHFKYVYSMCLANGIVLVSFIGAVLYNMSMLMKPSYFLPRIEIYFYQQLSKIKAGHHADYYYQECFTSLEVIINIAKMSSKREEVKVVFQVIEICHKALMSFIEDRTDDDDSWRKNNCVFIRGLSEEAKLYLNRELKWPEAYIFFCLKQLFDVPEANKNEIIGLYSKLLLESLEAAIDVNDKFLVELHIMTFNSLFEDNIILKKEKNIATLGHSFSVSVQLLVSDKDNLRFAFKSYFYLFKKVHLLGMHSTSIYLISDLSKSLIMMGNEDQDFALEIYEQYLKKQWSLAAKIDEIAEEMYEMITRLYWELNARKSFLLSEKIYRDHIKNQENLLALSLDVVKHSRTLSYELNDRLIGFTFISKKCRRAINEYLDNQNQIADIKSLKRLGSN